MEIYEYFTNLFRKDPISTEYCAYLLLKERPLLQNVNYLAIPWVTLINRKILNKLEIGNFRGGFTICQHADYEEIVPMLIKAGIDILFTPHADREYKNIRILPFPHYAASGSSPAEKKDVFYSFIGVDSSSLIGSGLRGKIFNMHHPENTVIIQRKEWHWARGGILSALFILRRIRERKEYSRILARSRFSLCPRGYGISTIRFWESLGAGAIPVLLADALKLPRVKGVDWNECIVRVEEKDALKIPEILLGIPEEMEKSMKYACLQTYEQFSGENFVRCIRETYNEK